MEYRFERISKENLKDFLALYQATHNQEPDQKHYERKFDTAFTGASHIGFLAYSQSNEVAAYYGVFPTLCQLSGQQILAAQSGDTMTHPNHRRKGLFRLLFEETAKLAKEEGIRFIFGFPNEASYPGFIKFGWKECAAMYNHILPLNGNKIMKVKRKFLSGSYDKSLEQQCASKQYRGSIPVQSLNVQNKAGGVLHDKNYFDYKSNSNGKIYAFENGYIWGTIAPYTFDLGNIFPTSSIAALLEEVKAFAEKIGSNEITFTLLDGSPIQEHLKGWNSVKRAPLIYWPLDESVDYSESLTYYGSDSDVF